MHDHSVLYSTLSLSRKEVKNERTRSLLVCHFNLSSNRVGEVATILTTLFVFDIFWKRKERREIALSTVYSADVSVLSDKPFSYYAQPTLIAIFRSGDKILL